MEVKVNKEIRNFSEAIFFGLSMRQFIFSLFAIGVAVALYFLLQNIVGQEEVGWMCIVGAFPFAAAGFFSFQGLPLEQVIKAWIRSEWLCPKKLSYSAENLYIRALIEQEEVSSKKGRAKYVSYHKRRIESK